MKPIYSDTEVQFVRMKEQPKKKDNGLWEIALDKNTTITTDDIETLIARKKPPYLPGEKCYLREPWADISEYCPEQPIAYKAIDWKGWLEYEVDPFHWMSPITMPAKFARRFFTIVSCEPMQKDGEWCWKLTIEPSGITE